MNISAAIAATWLDDESDPALETGGQCLQPEVVLYILFCSWTFSTDPIPGVA